MGIVDMISQLGKEIDNYLNLRERLKMEADPYTMDTTEILKGIDAYVEQEEVALDVRLDNLKYLQGQIKWLVDILEEERGSLADKKYSEEKLKRIAKKWRERKLEMDLRRKEKENGN